MAKTDPSAAPLLNHRYQLLDIVGEGGMAVVWRARDKRLGREVAVKLLRDQYAADPEFLERFRREAQSAAGLNDPGVVGVYDVGEDGGRHYLVMEYVAGKDLKSLIRSAAPLPVATALQTGLALARAVAAAHATLLVHRDIKPQNVLLTPDGRIKVADFGIARAVAAAEMTAPGLVLGTVHYIAPEQAAGGQATLASDVYSLGVVLYEMLAGRVPFDADSTLGVAMKIMHEDPEPIEAVNTQVPGALAAIIRRAMARRPEDRFPDAAALAAALEAFVQSAEQVTRGFPAAAGSATAAGAASAAGATLRPPPTRPAKGALSPGDPAPVGTNAPPAGGATANEQSLPREPAKNRQHATAAPVRLPLLDRSGLVLALIATVAMAGLIPLWLQVWTRLDPQALPLFGAAAVGQESAGAEPGTLGADLPQPADPNAQAPAIAPESVAVPDVGTLDEIEAASRLRALGLGVTVEHRLVRGVKAGQVISQSIPAGERVPGGQVVALAVAGAESNRVTVPDLAGQTYQDAADALHKLNLVPQYRELWAGANSPDEQKVVAMSPPAGNLAMPGQKVVVTVNSGGWKSLGATFGDGLYLSGAYLARRTLAPGETLTVAPAWEAVADVEANYTAHAILTDAAGNILAQDQQNPPASGRPTSEWAQGEQLEGAALNLGLGGVPVGQYQLWIFLDREDGPGNALAVRSPGATSVSGNRVLVMDIEVAQGG